MISRISLLIAAGTIVFVCMAGGPSLCPSFCMESAGTCDPQAYSKERQRMVDEQIRSRGVKDPLVLQTMAAVARHCFVPFAFVGDAYDDHPLPIGMGQTISQPYIVAFMTELLKLNRDDRVLEIGTGSGYQAAVLASLVRDVYSIEIISSLSQEAAARLDSLGYKNVNIRTGDGYQGWAAQAPFDAIIVTAAANRVPPPLIEQLKPGGRMCIPVGNSSMNQKLTVIEKDLKGSLSTRVVLPVRFVPLVRDE